ncbi:MAG: hypothetical protein AB1938_17240 [Myxococcota bacterium]
MSSRHLEAYLASLPRGVDSYPDCVQKVSISREFLRFLPSAGLSGKVPAPVEELLGKRLPASAWVPEVHACALLLAILDAHFSDAEAFVARAYVANKELLTGPLYRMLMFVASPLYLARNAESRWNTFHRGIKMATESLPQEKSGTAVFRLEYPRLLLPEVLARSYSTAFKAALEAAGGRSVQVEVAGWQPETCRFSCTWS